MTSPAARVIDRDFLVDIGGWQVLKQAQAMVAARRVHNVRYDPPVLSADINVDGRVLTTRLKATPRLVDVENLCTCRQAREDGTICAHVMAAGWAWIEGQREASRAAARVGAAAPATLAKPKEAPTWPRHILGNHPAEAVPLELFVLLPLSLPEALATGKVRLILEARADLPKTPTGAAGAKPWDALPRDAAHVYAVTEEDEALLRWIERHNAGQLPGMSMVPGVEIASLLRMLRDHPRVMLGKKAAVRVSGAAARPRLVLTSRDAGGLTVGVEDLPTPSGEVVRVPGGAWAWRPTKDGGGELEEVFALPGPYAVLAQGPVELPPDAVPGFLTQELPALSATMEVEQRGGAVRFESAAPVIEVKLDGSLAGLGARVEAVYGAERFLLTPKFAQGAEPPADAAAWRADLADARRFWQRDVAAERRATDEVLAAGFTPGHRSPDQFFLAKEREVADFLANRLPRWKAQWRVGFGSRLANVWERVEVVEPELTLREGGSGEDWLSLDLDVRETAASGKVDLAEVRRWLATGQAHRRVPAADGGPDRILLIPTAGWRELEAALADSQVEQRPGGPARLDPKQAPYLANVAAAQGWELSAQSTWPPREDLLAPLPALPEAFDARLRPYQRQGVEWLAGLARRHFGGLLADEMGLGKTIQMLAFLRRLLAKRIGKGGAEDLPPALVVAPTSLVENWRAEAERFTPELRVLVLQGPERAARFAEMDRHDLLLTSYALLRRDGEQYAGRTFSAAILDEAQHIKNRASQNARSAKAIEAQHRFVLTGTPLENSLLDLWSIYDFLLPGYLGTANDFRDRYEQPITRQGDAAAQERLRHRLQPFFLRRTKAEVIRDLPEKLEQVAWCDLTPEQTQVYAALLEQGRRDVFDAAGKEGKSSGRNRLAVLAALLRLRQASCHLGLLPAKDQDWKEPSGKFEMAMELLEEALDGGHRVLVFSQFVKLLGLLRERLDAAGTAYAYLDGGTPAAQRQAEVARFQATGADAPPVFLISLKAGGTGLNLTSADTVLHLDPWWNPAVEDQATARAHRIGQQRVVNAYKLIARGTVEEKILSLQQKKRELIAANVASEELFVESLTDEEMRSLFV